MTYSLTKPKWGLFTILVLLIAGSNAAIYRFPFMQPVPAGAKNANVILLNADEARQFISDVSAKINRA
ncbi:MULTISPECIES: hypothetical protein [Metabacillus]|uniref:Uncharacterized protein n=1 Tax=Metabacillus hrfriensis TaxID=3048891 RepID=A0ACD4REL3_9BACI|nr:MULTISPECIES: hypothetical protein [Metabacillus]UAL53382.1 hypothetical protein K8L98_06210 [Metabacillus dongyingensis]UOK58880.1 hypothetical protein MGI18_07570 [Bacillus sp. OVS6]USK29704.1 hypothetical protein LIT32_06215 [Bacillus sp. CMF21]WHZ58948.1 hypothetical protein QLQ22_06310 [Metabacillus sp. CT-WN-B3]